VKAKRLLAGSKVALASALALSARGWPDFESSYDSQVIGLWRIIDDGAARNQRRRLFGREIRFENAEAARRPRAFQIDVGAVLEQDVEHRQVLRRAMDGAAVEPADGRVDGRADLGILREQLTDEEILFFCFLLIVAGNETTRQGIALGTLALAQHPDEYAKLRADRSLVPSAVEELLRYSSPVWFFRRTSTANTQLRGVDIAAGDRVTVWFAAANRDPEHYPDPHRFDVGRNPADSLTFGRGGPHHCLGAHLARLEMRVYVEELLERVERVEVTGPPRRLRSNFTNGLGSLPVRLHLG